MSASLKSLAFVAILGVLCGLAAAAGDYERLAILFAAAFAFSAVVELIRDSITAAELAMLNACGAKAAAREASKPVVFAGPPTVAFARGRVLNEDAPFTSGAPRHQPFARAGDA